MPQSMATNGIEIWSLYTNSTRAFHPMHSHGVKFYICR